MGLSHVFRRVEADHNIPRYLLEAVALCESSTDPRRMLHPHPWAISSGGRARYFKSKAEAVRTVSYMLKLGGHSIDIGCMQVNLVHHPRAFTSLEQAFDPIENITYAAKFLKKLRASSGSWLSALARYHSGHNLSGQRYRDRVLQIWRKLKYKYVNFTTSKNSIGAATGNIPIIKNGIRANINNVIYNQDLP